MLKITPLHRKKVILIALAILILCGIIAMLAIFNMSTEKEPNKAVYVLEAVEENK
ncbi:hypothetical protein LY28_03036 [Ruminiclostridium sufflavum DSM 19573]|uniref:Uncharacterized protein n=1 Tax=Ruminiclostridium sufflavum DSM 19573 TaxID=1121337 RepID=A0A318XU69_9FIRM|nr:hypothetical protein [Ruminiclostridium sufflavum]PYG85882.1 hypothetical protein LY28_03036 [Ruminiclostridium sufflavum DSM 19573]